MLTASWVLVWGDCFVLSTRVAGLARTVRLIGALARFLPMRNSGLSRISRRLSRAAKRFGPLFLAGEHPCLIRGLILYFYGKRMRRCVRLVVGARKQQGSDRLLWHCWVTEEEPCDTAEYVAFYHFD